MTWPAFGKLLSELRHSASNAVMCELMAACSSAAEAARTDRLGKGGPQKIEPLSGVLAKIMERKQAIVQRWVC